jgi:quercetin dioxygenase-like cupin family protein
MNPLLGRQFTSGAHVMVSRITLAKGAQVPLHSHLNEQVAVLLTGQLRFVFYDKAESPATPTREVILSPDETLVIPPHLPHEAFALEDTVNLDIFSPPRQDWLSGDDAYLRLQPPSTP